MVTVEELCSRGHDLNKLITEYPISLVRSLIEASQWNKRMDLLLQAQAITIGVSNSLDGAFGKGKGKILEKFEKALFKGFDRSKNIDEAANKILGIFNVPDIGQKDGE